ncbi:MAG: DUF2259 domain-containing protein [Alphaproteobacteria bacterium]|nr:DUF2259 domain-containing protein [Alphaproteobacteria bacterium]
MLARALRIAVALFGAVWANLAVSAESALVEPIGYAENLRYFAFEQYGVQDGSGFAYSDIFVIDLSEDRWVVGTPIRMIGETEEESLGAVRARARAEAEPYFVDLAITVPAHLLASNGDGEPDADGKALTFALPAPSGPGYRDGRFELRLEQYPAAAGSPCEEWFAEKALGFILKLTDFAPTREVHRDEVLPRSRGCPADYRIHSIYAPFGATSVAHTLALIAVYAHGFEGLDRRFVGIALAKNQAGL